MAMEQGSYAKVVKLNGKDLKLIVSNKNKKEAKFKFQGQSARSQRWFDSDFDWIEIMFEHMNLVSIRFVFRSMTIHKIQIHLKYFLCQ